ncbi:type II toxin-antitoxin system VapC family toxin [Pyxidicoccus trucidator]|uniref:type II toxin-antitoxin system VapC family toxin n=1 Tax=Pyxidicoccus trucidator TaxID=2709662 RepID=UPI0030843C34
MIDLSGLPHRIMFDSSVLTRTRANSTAPHSELCQELFRELLRSGRHILIPAVALAEYMRRPPHDQPKRHSRVEVVAFDQDAAVDLATKLPNWPVIKMHTGTSRTVAKYDEMILASAIRHNAELLLCMDTDLIEAAKLCKVPVLDPTTLPHQESMIDVLMNPAASAASPPTAVKAPAAKKTTSGT